MSDSASSPNRKLQRPGPDHQKMGIDLSSQRSPFKNTNKQLQAQADGMPLETDSNVVDEVYSGEQQESHIDLINETTKMKHLAQGAQGTINNDITINDQQQKHGNIVQQRQGTIIQEPKVGNSPKAQLSHYLNQNSGNGVNNVQSQQTTTANQTQESRIQNLSSVNYGINNLSSLSSISRASQFQNGELTETDQLTNQITLGEQDHQKLEYCQKCIKRINIEEKQINIVNSSRSLEGEATINEEEEYYYEKIRFLIVDCRLESLQREALLPNSYQFQVHTECNKESLQQQIEDLNGCKDIYHICLVGLDQYSCLKESKKFETNNNQENILDIKDYHERILKFLIEEFQSKGFKYISIMPGGFEECHDKAIQYGFQMINHTDGVDLEGVCYHCNVSNTSKALNKQKYNQQFSLIGFSEIISGFKHWYDVANSKLRSFVKGPIKMLGGGNTNLLINEERQSNQSNLEQVQQSQESIANSGQSSIFFTSVTSKNSQGKDSRNQGPFKQGGKHLHKTTESNKIFPPQNNDDLQVNNNNQQPFSPQTIRYGDFYQQLNDNNQIIQEQVNLFKSPPRLISQNQNVNNDNSIQSLSSLPISFVSQSSRQEVFTQSQGIQPQIGPSSQCGSNVSINSFQNDSSHLRDAISNKKIMSYKLSSKVPGGINQKEIEEEEDVKDGFSLQNNENKIEFTHKNKKPIKNNGSGSLNNVVIVDGNEEEELFQKDLERKTSNLKANSSHTVGSIISYQSSEHQSSDHVNSIEINIAISQQNNNEQFKEIKQEQQQNNNKVQQIDNSKEENKHNNESNLKFKNDMNENDNENGRNSLSNTDNIRIELTQEVIGNSTTSIKSTQAQNGFYNLQIEQMALTGTDKGQNLKEHLIDLKKDINNQPQKKGNNTNVNNNVQNHSVQVNQISMIDQENYYQKGMIKQVELNKDDFENVIIKKSYNVYKTQKLWLKKKQDIKEEVNPVQQPQDQSLKPIQQTAYPVYLIISSYTVSVIREIPQQIQNQHDQQIQQQNAISSTPNQPGQIINNESLLMIDEWDQADFDELHSSIKQQNDIKNRKSHKPSQTQKYNSMNDPIAIMESRFLMHDLIKITSRKSSSKIITFYFRIPTIDEYLSFPLETNIIQSLDQKPPSRYIFAFKRKNFKEISVSFEFSKEEDAKQCISNVSTIYKKLKNKKSSQ